MTDNKDSTPAKITNEQQNEEIKKEGTVTDPSSLKPKHLKATPPAINTPVGVTSDDDQDASIPLTLDQQEALIGDGEPGELGYIELDQDGKPVGGFKRGIPDPDVPVAAVFISPLLVKNIITTPAGAPLTSKMNTSPDLMAAANRTTDQENRDYAKIAEKRKDRRAGIKS